MYSQVLFVELEHLPTIRFQSSHKWISGITYLHRALVVALFDIYFCLLSILPMHEDEEIPRFVPLDGIYNLDLLLPFLPLRHPVRRISILGCVDSSRLPLLRGFGCWRGLSVGFPLLASLAVFGLLLRWRFMDCCSTTISFVVFCQDVFRRSDPTVSKGQ